MRVRLAHTLIFIENPTDLKVLSLSQLKSSESKVFSFNIHSHKILEEKSINHEIAENYITYDERLKLFDLTVSYHEWYKRNPILKEFELEDINLLGILDTAEFHQYLLHQLISFLIIKRIIEKEKPTKIIATTNFSTIAASLVDMKKTIVKSYHNSSTEYLERNRIEIKFNIGRIPISFDISRNVYGKIMNMMEYVLGTFFNLWFNFKNKRKTIILLEFDPSAYSQLITHLSKYGKNVVLLNKRRSALWNLTSIKILLKSKCKLLNLKKILDKQTKNQISFLLDQYLQKLERITSNDDFLRELFSLEGFSFWPSIKDILIDTYRKRIPEYVYLIISSKKFFEKTNVSCIVSLNVIGETEKAVLSMNKNNAPSILLEHAYANYVPEISRYDILSMYSLFGDKIAVWGDVQKQYLLEQRRIDTSRILVTGSPRHDLFFNRKITKKKNSKKTILITLHAITETSGQSDTYLYIKYENLIKELYTIIKKMTNVEVIVKLHPGQDIHNREIKKLFKKIDSTIPIYQIKPIIELLDSCNVLVNVSSEGFDPSTVILEAIILNKPVMNIILDDKFYEFLHVKDGAVLSVFDKLDLEKNLHDILYNEELRNRLIQNGKKHLINYLSNHGTASQYLASLLNSY